MGKWFFLFSTNYRYLSALWLCSQVFLCLHKLSYAHCVGNFQTLDPFPGLQIPQPTSLFLGSSTWKSVKTASGNSAHLSHCHWHNEAKCFGTALIAWSESLGGQKTLFLTDFWPVSPHLLSAIFQAGLLKTAASWHPHFHLCILFPSRQPGILSMPLSKRFTRATLCSNPSWRPTSLRKNQNPSNGLGWP